MSFVPQDYALNVARGLVSGAQQFSGYGKRVTAGAESNVLWSNGAYNFPPTAGVQMSVVSTSANDAAAGTGIRTIEIHYIDANLAPQSETVTMNGTTPVSTVATNIRFVQCLHLVTAGSGKSAAGIITLANGGITYAMIEAGAVRCASSVRMVPAGKRLLVTSAFLGSVSGSAGAATTISLATPNFDHHDLVSQGIFIPLATAAFQDNSGGFNILCPSSFTEGEIVGMTFTTDKAATIVGAWFGWLENV